MPGILGVFNDLALAGRADLQDSQPPELRRLAGWARCGHPPASLQGCHAVGLRQADGMPHPPQRRR
ncbi:MAG: hypothetical protein WCF33_16700 [Pseudonocardiaceae bacterium]